MFDLFMSKFHVLPRNQLAGHAWRDVRLTSTTGYSELYSRFAGCTFDNGLYRLHDAQSGPRSAALIAEAFPDYARRACPFAYDWLGRQFALDAERVEGGESLVLLLEPGTGEALEVPLSFASFHEQLDEHREPALAAESFSQWALANPGLLPVKHDECVGYRVPLFLDGRDAMDNLEVVDLAVYWSLCGQLYQGTMHLPPGTSIQQVSLGE